MPAPVDLRKKPLDVRIHVSSGVGVDITWSDGHSSHYDFHYLREHCPCAGCADEQRKRAEIDRHSPAAGPAALRIFKPRPSARSAEPVGQYAIKINFTDGHSTGIYSFDYLREICPCDACHRDFHSTVSD
jgi:DUF971 family protein